MGWVEDCKALLMADLKHFRAIWDIFTSSKARENGTNQHLTPFLSLRINLITPLNIGCSPAPCCILIQASHFKLADCRAAAVSLSTVIRKHSYWKLFLISLFRSSSSRQDHCSKDIKWVFFNLKRIQCLFLGAQEVMKRN